MDRKLRINVVCSSRDRRFLVVAEREWTLSIFLKCTEDMFHSLYPHDPKLKVAGIQNEFHFDIPLNYKVEEVLVDAGLVFILEKEVSLFKALSQTNSAELISKTSDVELLDGDLLQSSSKKKRKTVKKISRSVKIQTSHSECIRDSSSSNTVTSTTSPTLGIQANLMPQIIEKISEDSEVDIESVDDSITQPVEGTLVRKGMKRKSSGRKTSQHLLHKARKLKKKT